MKILIIDSNMTYLKFIREYLGGIDYNEIDTAGNPLEALENIKNNEYDIIICDVLMKKMNGIELLDIIKSLNSRAKVIIHTNSIDDNFRKLAFIKGAYNYYQKPSYHKIKSDVSILSRGY
jgi:two-component system response regulator HydG